MTLTHGPLPVLEPHLEDYEYEITDYEGARARWCPGCGDHSILTAVQRLLAAEQLTPENTVFVSGIGCSSRFPHYLKTYGFHGIHGRALPVATGIRLHRPDLTVFVVMGDGDCTSIGAGHWVHALRYNLDMVVMLLDNGIYGLTKQQTSPTTPQGFPSNTQPRGSWLPALNPLSVALGVTNASFVAQTAEWVPAHLYATLRAARAHRGLSFVRILQRCPVYSSAIFLNAVQDPANIAMLVHDDGVVVPELGKLYKQPVAARPARSRRGAPASPAPPTGCTSACSTGTARSRATRRRGASRRARPSSALPSSKRSSTVMPSDPRTAQALSALAQPIAEFRTLVETALAQADALLAAQTATPDDARPPRARQATRPLRRFAYRRGGVRGALPDGPPCGCSGPRGPAARHGFASAVRARGDDLFVVNVPPGGRLGAMVGAALSAAGRAFGAVMLTELVRGGRYEPDEHDRLLDDVEFPNWTKAERRVAPPLVVEVDGADLHAGAITDFLDGREKLVLVVRGACGPAALARCITPGTLVLQTADGTGLDRVASFDGPAIAALVPEEAAIFLHDPLAGREPWQRLVVQRLPEPPRRGIRGLSAFQMAQDLSLLGDLARTPFAVPAGGGAGTPAVGAADAVDRLASWLIGQSGLDGQA